MAAETSRSKRFPGETDEGHPELFTKIPQQPTEKKEGQLTNQQLHSFFNDGYLIIEDFLPHAALDDCLKGVEELVQDVAADLFKAGKVKSLYEEFGVFERLIKLNEDFPGANIILIKRGIMPKAIQDLWSCDRLLNVAEQILGTGDIIGHPVWNLRAKAPQNSETTVPWHQDAGYLENSSYSVLQITAWIPLLDVDEKNGCLQVLRKGHRSGKIARHQSCFADTWYVWADEADLEKDLGVNMSTDVVTCPIQKGSLILFNNVLPHRSLNNASDKIRWSLDLRWQRADCPVGFYGVKGGILMRSSQDPNHQIDWDSFNKINRMTEEKKTMKSIETETEFDTTIQGPWMTKWEITNTNRHTDRLPQQNA